MHGINNYTCINSFCENFRNWESLTRLPTEEIFTLKQEGKAETQSSHRPGSWHRAAPSNGSPNSLFREEWRVWTTHWTINLHRCLWGTDFLTYPFLGAERPGHSLAPSDHTEQRHEGTAARGHFRGPAPTPSARCPRRGRPSSRLLTGKAHTAGALRLHLKPLTALRRPGFGLAYLLYDGELREPGSVPAVENWVDSGPSPPTAVLRQPRGGADGGSSWGSGRFRGPLFRPSPRRARFFRGSEWEPLPEEPVQRVGMWWFLPLPAPTAC